MKFKDLNRAKAAYENGEISLGELDDNALAEVQKRNFKNPLELAENIEKSYNPRQNEEKMYNYLESFAGPDDYKQHALNTIKWRGNWDVGDMIRKEEWMGPYDEYDYDSKDDEQLSDEFYGAVEDGLIDGRKVFDALIGRMSDDEVGEYAKFYELFN